MCKGFWTNRCISPCCKQSSRQWSKLGLFFAPASHPSAYFPIDLSSSPTITEAEAVPDWLWEALLPSNPFLHRTLVGLSYIWAQEYECWKETPWACVRETVTARQRHHGSGFSLTELSPNCHQCPHACRIPWILYVGSLVRPGTNPRPKTLASQSYIFPLPECFFLSSTFQVKNINIKYHQHTVSHKWVQFHLIV